MGQNWRTHSRILVNFYSIKPSIVGGNWSFSATPICPKYHHLTISNYHWQFQFPFQNPPSNSSNSHMPHVGLTVWPWPVQGTDPEPSVCTHRLRPRGAAAWPGSPWHRAAGRRPRRPCNRSRPRVEAGWPKKPNGPWMTMAHLRISRWIAGLKSA